MRTAMLLGASVVLLALGTSAAQAENYSFSFTSAGGNVSGQVTTNSNSSGVQSVVALTGSYNGQALTLLPPGGAYSSFGATDNLFYSDMTGTARGGATGGYVDQYGFGFSAGGTNYAIAYNGPSMFTGFTYAYTFTPDVPNTVSPNGTLAIADLGPSAISAAPEPGTWALMLGGVGLVGAMMRVAQARRREEESKTIATA